MHEPSFHVQFLDTLASYASPVIAPLLMMHHFLQPEARPSGYSVASLSATAGLEKVTGYFISKQHGAPPARSAPYTSFPQIAATPEARAACEVSCTKWGVEQSCVDAMLALSPEDRSEVTSRFAPRPGTQTPVGFFLAFCRCVGQKPRATANGGVNSDDWASSHTPVQSSDFQGGTRGDFAPRQFAGNISDYLVERVKELQKRDEAAWYNYADQTGGKRDPAKHSLNSLQRFMQGHTAGERWSLKPHEGRLELALATQAMLRCSVAFKDAWTGFCTNFGGGLSDPLMHDPSFHVQFMDTLARYAIYNHGHVRLTRSPVAVKTSEI